MGLSAREKQALRSIEGSLTASAPGLASRLAIFTRLNVGEEFPARERIRKHWRGRAHYWSSVACRWPLAWPMLWLVVSVTLIAVGMAVGHHGAPGTCHELTCAWHAGGSAPG